MQEQRLLLPTCMLEAAARQRHRPRVAFPPVRRGRALPDSPETRIEALKKLKALFDSGVLTYQQFADEHDRLLDD